MPFEVKPAGGEVERQLTLDNPEGETHKQLYKHFKDQPENSRFEVGARAIAQCLGYMRDMGAKFGVITTYNKCWFLKEEQVDIVSISDAIECTSTGPTVLQATMYILHQAATDNSALYPTVRRDEPRLTGSVHRSAVEPERESILITQQSEADAVMYASTMPALPRTMELRSQSARQPAASSVVVNPQTGNHWERECMPFRCSLILCCGT